MNSSETQILQRLRGTRPWLIALGISIPLVAALILPQGHLYTLAGGIVIIVALFVAARFPLIAVTALLLTAVLPTVFQMTPFFSASYSSVGYGLNAEDIVLLLMAGALVLQLLGGKRLKHRKLGLSVYVTLFGLLILYEILRNISAYGVSAPGEFRYRYMILFLPLYVGLLFDSAKKRLNLFKMLIFAAVFFPIICVPVIGQSRGWLIGSYDLPSRFLQSDISLGLVYGLVGLFLGEKYGLVRVGAPLLWISATLVAILVVVDSHRSVWLAAAMIILTLILSKEIGLPRIWAWGTAALASLVIVWFALSGSGLDVVKYVETRGVAFVNPEKDQTAFWRLAMWEAQLEKFNRSPILGDGFGGYWEVYVPAIGGKVNLSPHSLYVQTLVKLGILGLSLYLIIVLRIFARLRRWIVERTKTNPESAIVITGLVVLVAAHAFYFTYSFEYYTWLFVGLGVAVVRDKSNTTHGE